MLPSRKDYVNKRNIAGTFENQILYGMCLEQPKHVDPYFISGKLIAIGRTYSASIERKAGKPKPRGSSFFDYVSECFAVPELDDFLNDLPNDGRIDDKSVLKKVIECHEHLVYLIKKSTKSWDCKKRNKNWKAEEKASFASKYLHFHKPNAFPLMDSIAKKGLQREGLKGASKDYKNFCYKVVNFSEGKGKSKYKCENWTPRRIDNELRNIGRKEEIKKQKP